MCVLVIILCYLAANMMMLVALVCTVKAILKGDEEVKAWLDYESVPLDEVSAFLHYCCDIVQ